MIDDDEPEIVSEYDFDEDAMGLGDWVAGIVATLPDSEIVVTVYDEQGRGAKSAKFVREDGVVSLIIEFDRGLG
jgi:hypothetical protein